MTSVLNRKIEQKVYIHFLKTKKRDFRLGLRLFGLITHKLNLLFLNLLFSPKLKNG